MSESIRVGGSWVYPDHVSAVTVEVRKEWKYRHMDHYEVTVHLISGLSLVDYPTFDLGELTKAEERRNWLAGYIDSKRTQPHYGGGQQEHSEVMREITGH